MISAVVLLNGRVIGVWSIERKGKRCVLEIEPFENFSKKVRTMIGEEASSLEKFLETSLEIPGILGRLSVPQTFDAVIGNPPYNAYAGVSPTEEKGLVEPYKKGLVKNWRIKDEPSAFKILKEINGYDWATKKPLASFANLMRLVRGSVSTKEIGRVLSTE